MRTKKLVLAALFIAIASTLSIITIIKMPFGGSVTPFSMLFIVLIAYYLGGKIGVFAGFAYGIIQFILGPYFLTPTQVFLDYGLAFVGLSFGAFIFLNKEDKHQLEKQYIFGVLCRFIFSVISGCIFFAEYTPDGMNFIVYSVLYNALYLFTEGVLTLIVLSIPQVKKVILKLRMEKID